MAIVLLVFHLDTVGKRDIAREDLLNMHIRSRNARVKSGRTYSAEEALSQEADMVRRAIQDAVWSGQQDKFARLLYEEARKKYPGHITIRDHPRTVRVEMAREATPCS